MIIAVIQGVAIFLIIIYFLTCIVTCSDYTSKFDYFARRSFTYKQGVRTLLQVINEMWEDAFEWGNKICCILIWCIKGPQIALCLTIFTTYRLFRGVCVFLLRRR